MQQLLVINPNTSTSVTELLLAHAQMVAGPDVLVRAVTARFGAPYIACEASYTVAGHATLDAWATDLRSGLQPAHAVLIGCFGDPALLALRETSSAAVTGLAEAAFTEASSHGRFAIVTGGDRWKPMLQRLAQALGFDDRLAGIHTVAPTGVQLANDPDGAKTLLQQACLEALHKHDVQAIILGGAGLAGLAAHIQPYLQVPVIDSASAGVRQALLRIAMPATRGSNAVDFPWGNVSPELQATGS
jgi:allantoin racemase